MLIWLFERYWDNSSLHAFLFVGSDFVVDM